MKPTLIRTAVALAFGVSAVAIAQTPAPTPSPAPTTPNAPLTPAPASTSPGAPAASSAPVPGAPRPFKDIVKDAKETKGFFTLWQKDDKVWMEVSPAQLDKPFFLSIVNTQGLGERRIYGGLMALDAMVVLKKVGSQMQLIVKNDQFRAPAGSPSERALKSSFSDSLIASGSVASAPHPETKAILVEVNTMLLTDIPGAATALENSFRIPYALDGRNSSLVSAETSDTSTASTSRCTSPCRSCRPAPWCRTRWCPTSRRRPTCPMRAAFSWATESISHSFPRLR